MGRERCREGGGGAEAGTISPIMFGSFDKVNLRQAGRSSVEATCMQSTIVHGMEAGTAYSLLRSAQCLEIFLSASDG